MAKRICDNDGTYVHNSTKKYARQILLQGVSRDVKKQLNDIYSNTLNQLNTAAASTNSDEVMASSHSGSFQDHSGAIPDNIDFPADMQTSSQFINDENAANANWDRDDYDLLEELADVSDFYSTDEDHSTDEEDETLPSIGLKELLDGCKELPLKDQLLSWALECGVPLAHLTKLLKILHPFHKELPDDARTLLRTPRHLNVQLNVIENGKFYYFGIAPNLKARLPNLPKESLNRCIQTVLLIDLYN